MNIRPDTVLYQVLSDIKAQAARVASGPAAARPGAPDKPAVSTGPSAMPDGAAKPGDAPGEPQRLRPRGSVVNILA